MAKAIAPGEGLTNNELGEMLGALPVTVRGWGSKTGKTPQKYPPYHYDKVKQRWYSKNPSENAQEPASD